LCAGHGMWRMQAAHAGLTRPAQPAAAAQRTCSRVGCGCCLCGFSRGQARAGRLLGVVAATPAIGQLSPGRDIGGRVVVGGLDWQRRQRQGGCGWEDEQVVSRRGQEACLGGRSGHCARGSSKAAGRQAGGKGHARVCVCAVVAWTQHGTARMKGKERPHTRPHCWDGMPSCWAAA
jgi:hypothetical protein